MPKVVRKFYRDGVEYKIKFDKSWKPGVNTILYYPLETNGNSGLSGGNALTTIGVTYSTESTGKGYAVFSGGMSNNGQGGYSTSAFPGLPLTFSFWAKTTGNGSLSPYGSNRWDFFSKETAPLVRFGTIPHGTSSGYAYCAVYVNGNTRTSYDYNVFTDGNWHYFTVVYSTSGIKWYIDNTLSNYYNGTLSSSSTASNTFYIGRNADTHYYGYNGGLSEFIVEDKERTTQEISAYYQNTKKNYGL